MQVNPSKFQLMFKQKLQVNELNQNIEVHGTFIPHNNEVKLLGITIDDKLQLDKQVDLLSKNSARQLNILYKFKSIFDLKERGKLYNTYFIQF